jgi:putative GTP pyrophosphokinase
MTELKAFLERFNISEADFKSTGLDWTELLKIKEDYEEYLPELNAPANYLVDTFHTAKIIHSVRFRIKNPTHLLAKIIRKKIEEPERLISLKNYKDEITDLIGLRALHLFKEDWLMIHHFITKTWDLKEEPIAYYRKGDSSEYIEVFKSNGCIVKEHPFGYRSVHYLVKTSPNKKTYVSEVQVRTIFEEGWSEIDHRIRYPYDQDNKLLNQFLVIFNRLSGSADEMGSYVQFLKNDLAKREKGFEETVNKLKNKIKELELQPKVQKEVENELDKLKLSNINSGDFKFGSHFIGSGLNINDYISPKIFDPPIYFSPNPTNYLGLNWQEDNAVGPTGIKVTDFPKLGLDLNVTKQNSSNAEVSKSNDDEGIKSDALTLPAKKKKRTYSKRIRKAK